MSSEKPIRKPTDRAEYDHLLETYRAQFEPQDVHERFLVEQMAHNQWKLMRIGQIREAASQGEIDETNPGVRMLDRYAAAAQKSYDRAYRELTKVRTQKQKAERRSAAGRTGKLQNKPGPPFDTAFRA
jgi:hypothetical protein